MNPLPVSAIIAAGGRGSRLSPLTDTTPKTLLEVGGKPILDWIIDHLIRLGIHDITITVGYRAAQIIDHLGEGRDRGVCFRYLHEDKPMGDVGVLGTSLVWQYEHLLLINADLFTDVDVLALYSEFLTADADMALATFQYAVQVPWGILDVSGNEVQYIREKPRLTFQANAGIYLFKRSLLSFIPTNSPFNAWSLIAKVLQAGFKVISTPISGYWYDIGSLTEYQRINTIVTNQALPADQLRLT